MTSKHRSTPTMSFLFFFALMGLFSACNYDDFSKQKAPYLGTGTYYFKYENTTVKEAIRLDDVVAFNKFLGNSSRESSKRSVVILTSATEQSVGAPSAASKFIKHILSKTDNIRFLWIVQKTNLHFQDYSLVPDGVPVLFVNGWDNLFDAVPRSILKNSDFISSLPTSHFFESAHLQFLDEFGSKFIRITEYDRRNSETSTNLRVFSPGLCTDCLGIFIEEPKLRNRPLESISVADQGLKTLLIEGAAANGKLYFGYFNRRQHLEASNTNATLVNFAITAVLTEVVDPEVSPTEGVIDIVVPATPEDFNKIQESLKWETLSKYAAFAEYEDILKNLEFEYVQSKKTVSPLARKSKDKKLVRIINAFPLVHDTMHILFQASEPFVGVTGNQSMSEAIGYGKITFYQTMIWTVPFFKNYIEFLNSNGIDRSLIEFYGSLNYEREKPLEGLLQNAVLLHNNTQLWQDEMRQVKAQILEKKNIDKLLIPTILEFILK